jgi:hypothetical protein
MPVSPANSFWLYPRNSRMMRTDSPTETSMRFLAGRKVFISDFPIIMRRDVNHLEHATCGVGSTRPTDIPLVKNAPHYTKSVEHLLAEMNLTK